MYMQAGLNTIEGSTAVLVRQPQPIIEKLKSELPEERQRALKPPSSRTTTNHRVTLAGVPSEKLWPEEFNSQRALQEATRHDVKHAARHSHRTAKGTKTKKRRPRRQRKSRRQRKTKRQRKPKRQRKSRN